MISISMFLVLVLLLCNVLIALIFFLMISNFVEKQVLKSLNENYDLVKTISNLNEVHIKNMQDMYEARLDHKFGRCSYRK